MAGTDFSNRTNGNALASLAQGRVNAFNSVIPRIEILARACVQRGGSILIRLRLGPACPAGPHAE
jgi:hypothetical protein